MAFDAGRAVVSSAGTPESLSGDLAANAFVRADSKVKDILFVAPASNAGNVFVGRFGRDEATSTVSSSYGVTLTPGDTLEMTEVNEKFDNFYVDAATTNDVVEWSVIF